MPTKRFSVVPAGPKRLAVSWGFRWKNFVIRLDDQEVGRIDGGFNALRLGSKFDLPEGSKLQVQLVIQKSRLGKVPLLHLYIDGKPVPGSEAIPLPKWAYAFVVACALIPIVTLGGAIAAGIGGGGAAACAALARDQSKTVNARVLFCIGVTALAWLSFAGFLSSGSRSRERRIHSDFRYSMRSLFSASLRPRLKRAS